MTGHYKTIKQLTDLFAKIVIGLFTTFLLFQIHGLNFRFSLGLAILVL